MLPMVRPYLKIPYMARESMLETLNLPALRKMPFLRCQDKDFDQVRTPVLPHDPTDLASLLDRKTLASSSPTTDSRCSSTRSRAALPTSVAPSISSTRVWSSRICRRR